MTNKAKTVFYNLARRKRYFDVEDSGATELARCLSTFDLIALGVGSTLGAGVYVLTGAVAHQVTGPSIILSFLVAAVASVMAGLCYAEFGSRVPKAGSAYVYSYVTVGECWAFIIGWNLILEYVIGTSSVARAWSENVDALLDGRLRNFSMTHLAINTPGLAEYPDFFAFIIILILTGVLCFGVKESALFTKIFTGINVAIILFVIIGGSIVADTKNWRLTPADITNFSLTQCLKARNLTYDGTQTLASLNCSTTNGMGKGGFLPFGFSGMIKGAATCFFGFVGFDVIATTGEEVKNPQRSIPISIVVSLGIVFVAYVGISSVLTLMVPYYILDIGAPLPRAFASVGWDWAVHPLAIGGTCALSSSLMGGLFPMPRVVYAMAQDGLIFKFLASVSKRFKTPIAATLLAGLLSAVMVLLFDLKDLVDMMSIGTLLAYTLVAACILILRYQPESRNPNSNIVIHSELATDKSNAEASGFSCHRILHPFTHPTQKSGQLVYICVLMIGTLNFAMCSILTNFHDFTAPLITILIVLACLNIALSCVILRQPQSQTKVSFMVPFVPILPLLSVFCNIYLMCELSAGTWIRFSVWMVIGAITYFGYGYKHSAENVNRDKRGTKLRTYNVEEEY